MRFLLIALCTLTCMAQPEVPHLGKFYDRYTQTKDGVSIELIVVHTEPRCLHYNSCAWSVVWDSKRQSDTVEVAVSVAGTPLPIIQKVPGKKATPHDKHNPIFSEFSTPSGVPIPLASVNAITLTFRKGTKDIKTVTFP